MNWLQTYLSAQKFDHIAVPPAPHDLYHHMIIAHPKSGDFSAGSLVSQVRKAVPTATVALTDRLLAVLAGLTGQEIGCQTLSRALKVTPKIALRLLVAAERAGVWRRLVCFDRANERVGDKSKGYLTSTAQACEHAGIENAAQLPEHPHWGALFETFIVNMIAEQIAGTSTRMYYWRTANGSAEVDIILHADGRLFPIEIKSTSHAQHKSAERITQFRRMYGKKHAVAIGVVIYTGAHVARIDDEVVAIPWPCLAQEQGDVGALD